MIDSSIFGFQSREPAPRQIPKRAFIWPRPEDTQNQIQQIRGAVQSPHANVNQVVLNPSSPQVVNNLVIHKQEGATAHNLTVQFKRNTQDQYFQGANVYLQTGKNPPVLVGSGTQSPIKLSVAKTPTPSTVFVQSVGRWGNTPLDNSPARAVNLSGATPVQIGTGSPEVLGGGGGGGGGGAAVTEVDTSAPITGGPITATGTVGITKATTSTDGYLSSTDWNTFNGKQNALNFADAEAITFTGTAFTLAHVPSPAGSLILAKVPTGTNPFAILLIGGGENYTLSGASGTLAASPDAGDSGVAWYRY